MNRTIVKWIAVGVVAAAVLVWGWWAFIQRPAQARREAVEARAEATTSQGKAGGGPGRGWRHR